MKVTNLRLRNIRSYKDESIDFPDGTMLVKGDNGAGKTTLLLSIFGGLFLSKIRNVGSNSFNLDDLVRRGSREGEISLTFEVEDVPYTVTWSIDTEGSNGAELDSPALSGPVSGIRDVHSKVVDIVGMDEDSFSRSVYVQQGEVDRLFDDDARAELIDDLLGLDQIDRYVLRMKGAKRAMKRIAKENEQSAANHLETINEQFDHDIEGYEEAIAEKESEISSLEMDIDEVEQYLTDLQDAKQEVEQQLDEHEELQTELEKARSEHEKLIEDRTAKQVEIEEAEKSIEEAQNEIESLRDKIHQTQDELDTLDNPSTVDPIPVGLSSAESTRETLDAAQEAVEAAQIKHANREAALSQAESEKERLIEERDAVLEDKKELKTDLEQVVEEKETLDDDLAAAEDALETAVEDRNAETKEFLSNESFTEPITDDTLDAVEATIETLRTDKSELSEERAATQASLEAAKSTQEDVQKDINSIREKIDSLTEKIEDRRSELENAHDEKEEASNRFEDELETLDDDLTVFDLEVTGDTLQGLIDEQIPRKKDELQDAIETINERVAKTNAQKSTLEESRDDLQSLDGKATCPTCGQDVDPEYLESELTEVLDELAEIEEELSEIKQERADLNARRDRLEELRDEAIELRKFRDDTVNETVERVRTIEDALETLEEDLDNAESDLNEAETKLESVASEIDELEQSIKTLEPEIDSLDSQIAAGQEVITAFESVEDRREERDELADRNDDLEDEQEELENDIAELDADIEAYETQIEEQDSEIDTAETKLEQAERAAKTVTEQRQLVSDADGAYGQIADLETTIEGHNKDIQHARETIENLNTQISGVEKEIVTIEEELGSIDVDELKEKLETATQKIEDRKETLDELTTELDSMKQDRALLENNLENLEYFHDQLALEEDKREWAQERLDEFDRMIAVYRSTKADLREQYLAYINEYTNDIFTDIYKNSSYQQVRILEEGPDGTPYAIQLLRDDGTLEHPSNASGGERAIVNLALRAGIYKLIAEMREGNSGRLPPFILDEPTTFLDDGHVGRLERMLESISEWDVPQVIVVSHDERLIQGADHTIEVRIDEDTNASRVDINRRQRIPGDD